jgi:hypothetical protein
MFVTKELASEIATILSIIHRQSDWMFFIHPLSRPSIFQKTSNLLCRERKLSILLCHEQMLTNLTTQLSFFIVFDMFPWTDFFAIFSQCPKLLKIHDALISGLFRLSPPLHVTSIPPSQREVFRLFHILEKSTNNAVF